MLYSMTSRHAFEASVQRKRAKFFGVERDFAILNTYGKALGTTYIRRLGAAIGQIQFASCAKGKQQSRRKRYLGSKARLCADNDRVAQTLCSLHF
jgi:hypothetical protein